MHSSINWDVLSPSSLLKNSTSIVTYSVCVRLTVIQPVQIWQNCRLSRCAIPGCNLITSRSSIRKRVILLAIPLPLSCTACRSDVFLYWTQWHRLLGYSNDEGHTPHSFHFIFAFAILTFILVIILHHIFLKYTSTLWQLWMDPG